MNLHLETVLSGSYNALTINSIFLLNWLNTGFLCISFGKDKKQNKFDLSLNLSITLG